MSHEKVDPDKEFAETHELANDFIKSKLQEKKLQGLPQGVMIEGYGNPLGHRQGHIDVKDQRGVPTGRSANEVTVGHTQHHDEWVRSVVNLDNGTQYRGNIGTEDILHRYYQAPTKVVRPFGNGEHYKHEFKSPRAANLITKLAVKKIESKDSEDDHAKAA